MSLDFIQKYPFILAFFFGLIPALVWLWFWLKEDTHPESARMITLSFLGGMTAVIFVLPLEQLVFDSIGSQNNLAFTIWAGIEEIFKFALVYFIALQNKNIADALDLSIEEAHEQIGAHPNCRCSWAPIITKS